MKTLFQLTHDLMTLTDAAMACCQDADWQSLELYQEQRASVLHEIRAIVEQQPDLDPHTLEAFSHALISTKEADQTIQQQVKTIRQQLLDENSDLLKSQSAHKLYKQND